MEDYNWESDICMKWTVVTDSAINRDYEQENAMNQETDNERNGVGFYTVPLSLYAGEREFIDDKKLDVSKMVRYLKEYNGKSGSAAPGPSEWKDAFEIADQSVAITLTSALSGSYRSACAARDMVLEEDKEKKIFVLDSLSAGPQMMLLADRALELARKEVTFSQMQAELEAYKEKTHILFVLEKMDNLMHNGRVSKLEGGVAALLGIRIIGETSKDGQLHIFHKIRGRVRAYDKLVEEMVSHGYQGGKVLIHHCNNKEKAGYVAQKIKALFPDCDIKISLMTGLCSFYAEDGGVMVGFECNR